MFLLLFAAVQEVDSLKGIFTRNIYLAQTDQELKRRKLDELNKKKIKHLKKEVKRLNTQYGLDVDLNTLSGDWDHFQRTLNTADNITSLGKITLAGLYGSLNQLVEDSSPANKFFLRGMALQRQSISGTVIERIEGFENLIKAYLQALESDDVTQYEKKYINIKANFPENLQKITETSLLLLYNTDGHAKAIEEQFVQNALKFPFNRKKLLQRNNLRQKLREFDTNNYFNAFNPKLRQSWRNIFRNILLSSITGGRSVFFLYGPKGTGKTSSVEKAAQFLKLPLLKISITGPDVLEKEKIEGKNHFSTDPIVGWIFQPLITEDSNGDTWTNPILLIDDLDLGLHRQQILTTLKIYLDSETEIKSPYFGCKVSLKDMFIFITSNKPIPDEEEYAPLKSRMKSVHYPDFTLETTIDMLNQYICNEFKKLGMDAPNLSQSRIWIFYVYSLIRKQNINPDFRNIQAELKLLTQEYFEDQDQVNTKVRILLDRLDQSPRSLKLSRSILSVARKFTVGVFSILKLCVFLIFVSALVIPNR